MERYVGGVGAKLVVMGSAHLTSSNINYVVGSVALSAVKRLAVPVMVVTANTRNIEGKASHRRVKTVNHAACAKGPSSFLGVFVALTVALTIVMPTVLCLLFSTSFCRALALVEGHARAMMPFLCSRVLDDKRSDRLMLAQVSPTRHLTRQQAANNRRLMDNFNLLAASEHRTGMITP